MPKRIIENSEEIMAQALKDYQDPSIHTDVIADKYGVSTSTLTVWAKRANLTLRKRGRKAQSMPSAKHQRIIQLAQLYSYEQVGQEFGLHKQAVHRIVTRWKDWVKPKTAPFSPGDVVKWDGDDLTVIDASFERGILVSASKNKVFRNFVWTNALKKAGHNPKYRELARTLVKSKP